MNLYLLSQNKCRGYDTYDSCIVAATNEDEARCIHPNKSLDEPWSDHYGFYSWAKTPDDVEVELLGEALKGTQSGLILASFNAG